MERIYQFLLFFVYAILIIIVAKYMMIYYIRKISYIFNLSTSTTGQIIGYATSVPELIGTIAAASVMMIDTSMFNIVSSNVINVFLFLFSVFFYKKGNDLIKKKFSIEYAFVITTIIIPLLALKFEFQTKWWLIPIFIVFYITYLLIYRMDESKFLNVKKENDSNNDDSNDNKKKALIYIFMLIISLVILYLLGSRLSISLESLGKEYGISELVLGILMGALTSLPELTSFLSSFAHHKEIDGLKSDEATVEAVHNMTSSNVSNLFIIQSIALIIYIIVSM